MPQPVVHFEIGCRDSAKTQQFFAQLFDWKIDQMGPAGMINTSSTEGIQGHFAWLADPEGTIVGLWKPARPQ